MRKHWKAEMGLWGTSLRPRRAAHQDTSCPRKQSPLWPSLAQSGSAPSAPSLLGCPQSLAWAPDPRPRPFLCSFPSGSFSTALGEAQASPSSKMMVTLPAGPLEPPSSLVFVPCFPPPSQPQSFRRKEEKAPLLCAPHAPPHCMPCPSGRPPPVSHPHSSAPFLAAFGSWVQLCLLKLSHSLGSHGPTLWFSAPLSSLRLSVLS